MSYIIERPEFAKSNSIIVSQGHDFVVGEQLYNNGFTWVRAQADQAVNLKQGMVTFVHDVQTFVLTYEGEVEIPNHGLPPGTLFYLDPATPGAFTPLPVTNPTQFAQPCFATIDGNRIQVLNSPATVGGNLIASNRVPILASGSGGFRRQNLTNLPRNTGWYRLGEIASYTTVELSINTYRAGTGAGSIQVVFGTTNNPATPDAGARITVLNVGGSLQVSEVRINLDGCRQYMEAKGTSSAGSSFDLDVAVTAESRASAFVFDPTFSQPATGATVVIAQQLNNTNTNFGVYGSNGAVWDMSHYAVNCRRILNMNSNLVQNVTNPVANQDAATKNYVDLQDTSYRGNTRGGLIGAEVNLPSGSHVNVITITNNMSNRRRLAFHLHPSLYCSGSGDFRLWWRFQNQVGNLGSFHSYGGVSAFSNNRSWTTPVFFMVQINAGQSATLQCRRDGGPTQVTILGTSGGGINDEPSSWAIVDLGTW
jgi:hypothetical protein